MKYLMIALTLLIAGCSSDESAKELKQVKGDLRYSNEQLQTCQNQLSFYRDSGKSNGNDNESSQQEEVETESNEPEYETVDAYELDKYHTTCYSREVEACGMTFTECKDGYGYRCMQDVKYKHKQEQKLVE